MTGADLLSEQDRQDIAEDEYPVEAQPVAATTAEPVAVPTAGAPAETEPARERRPLGITPLAVAVAAALPTAVAIAHPADAVWVLGPTLAGVALYGVWRR